MTRKCCLCTRRGGRGGQGVRAMDAAMRGGPLVASFPVETSDQIMLATSKGQSIRVPVDGISFRSRAAGVSRDRPDEVRVIKSFA